MNLNTLVDRQNKRAKRRAAAAAMVRKLEEIRSARRASQHQSNALHARGITPVHRPRGPGKKAICNFMPIHVHAVINGRRISRTRWAQKGEWLGPNPVEVDYFIAAVNLDPVQAQRLRAEFV